MEKNRFTKFTVEQSDLKINWECPYEDVTMSDMIKAFKTLLIGMTFSESTIHAGMRDYLKEYDDNYELTQ